MSRATMHTTAGPIEFELHDEDAPKTVENFRKLASEGFYDDLNFHRVIPDFMIQGGCPEGTGTGGPGYTFEDEFNDHKVERGALAMANAGPNTNGSQFFIVTIEEASWLDGKHTVFGTVVTGMEAVDAIEGTETGPGDRPVEPQVIERIELSASRATPSPIVRRYGVEILDRPLDQRDADLGGLLRRQLAAGGLDVASAGQADRRRDAPVEQGVAEGGDRLR